MPPRIRHRRPRGPTLLLELSHDQHPAALDQGLRGMLGLVAPHDHGEERRLLAPCGPTPPPGTSPGRCRCRYSRPRLVGEVAGEADAGLGHRVPLPDAWPGGLPCPWNRGRWTPWHAARPPGASGGANEVGPVLDQAVEWARLGCRVGWWGACGWVSVCQHRPARSLHPGRGGRTRLPPRGPLVGPS
jgi:hypothetical protein